MNEMKMYKGRIIAENNCHGRIDLFLNQNGSRTYICTQPYHAGIIQAFRHPGISVYDYIHHQYGRNFVVDNTFRKLPSYINYIYDYVLPEDAPAVKSAGKSRKHYSRAHCRQDFHQRIQEYNNYAL